MGFRSPPTSVPGAPKLLNHHWGLWGHPPSLACLLPSGLWGSRHILPLSDTNEIFLLLRAQRDSGSVFLSIHLCPVLRLGNDTPHLIIHRLAQHTRQVSLHHCPLRLKKRPPGATGTVDPSPCPGICSPGCSLQHTH